MPSCVLICYVNKEVQIAKVKNLKVGNLENLAISILFTWRFPKYNTIQIETWAMVELVWTCDESHT